MRLDKSNPCPENVPMEVHYSSRVTDYGGSKAYACYEENSHWPRIYFVRGDTFTDAYENFLQTLPVVGPDDPDLTDEDRAVAAAGGIPEGYDYADGHGLVYSERVQCVRILPYIGGEDY